LVAGARGNAALGQGEMQNGVASAGRRIGLIDCIPTCAELPDCVVHECREQLERARGWMWSGIAFCLLPVPLFQGARRPTGYLAPRMSPASLLLYFAAQGTPSACAFSAVAH
jgi:hypothetical protein